MRALIFLVLVGSLTPPAWANRCSGHCRDAARTCKSKCKLNHDSGEQRQDCVQACKVEHNECKEHCR